MYTQYLHVSISDSIVRVCNEGSLIHPVGIFPRKRGLQQKLWVKGSFAFLFNLGHYKLYYKPKSLPFAFMHDLSICFLVSSITL